jgi:hypothetical protein
MSRLRSITASLTAVAVLGAGSLSVAQAASTSSSTTSTTASTTAAERNARPPQRAMSATTLAAIAKTLGITSAELKAAMDANKPAAGTKPAKGAKGASLAKDLAAALGVKKSAVQTILDSGRPAEPAAGTKPTPGTKLDDAKLAAALATGLKLDEATVTAALAKLHAAHEADHDAMFTAIAKTLGLDAAKVQAAFEANRPAPPAGARAATSTK